MAGAPAMSALKESDERMLLRRAVLAPVVLGVVLTAGCNTTSPTHPDNPQKVSIRTVGAPRRASNTLTSTFAISDPRFRRSELGRERRASSSPPDVAGALLAVSHALAVLFPPKAPTPVQRPSASPTTSVPLQIVPQGQDYHRDGDWPIWSAIGQCEQPGPGVDGIAWTHGPGSTYPGGLGIFSGAWSDYHAEAGVPVSNGAYASPEQQMMVARVIRAHHGLSAWGCARMLGL